MRFRPGCLMQGCWTHVESQDGMNVLTLDARRVMWSAAGIVRKRFTLDAPVQQVLHSHA